MKPVIYQILPRYWGGYRGENVRGGSLQENGCGHFRDFDKESLSYIKSLGCTHVWYTGIIRHATSCDIAGCKPSHPQFVKGQAGSPYAIVDWYDVNPYLADNPKKRMEEFEDLVKRTHKAGLKVIIDFIPNHVSRDNVNFGVNDDSSVHWSAVNDFYYYPSEPLRLPGPFAPDSHYSEPFQEYPAKATGNCFSPSPSINDWYETVKLNYCDFHTTTWDKMLDILLFWAEKGVDGFRCDMVELVPPEFFAWLIPMVKEKFPGCCFIAEVYRKELYHKYLREVGFDYLYDKSGLYDALRDIMSGPASEYPFGYVELWQSAKRITANWQSLQDLQPQMVNFLENHDEQRVASDFFAGSSSKSFAALAASLLFNQAAFILYFGQEVGERGMYAEGFSGKDGRNSIFDWWKIDSVGRLWNHIHKSSSPGKRGDDLDEKELSCLKKYRELFALAQSDVIAEGATYDLCFCNYGSEGFDPDRHFVFLRYDKKKTLLVACNFTSAEVNIDVNIPVRSCRRKVQIAPWDYTVVEL